MNFKIYKMEGVYIMHTREFFNANLPIYKLGRSHNLSKRVKQYPIGSNIMCIIYCSNSILCEKKLILLFTKLFIRKKTYGNEYFEGDIDDMIFTIFKYLYKDKFKKKFNNTQPIFSEPVQIVEENTQVTEHKDRTCPYSHCRHVFQYPSGLKKHFSNSNHCKKTQPEINEFFDNIKKNKIEMNKCNKCSTLFTKHFLLLRHKKTCTN